MKEWLSNTLQKIDIFGHPIGLKYKKSTFYTSEAGGVLTILIIGVIVAYFGMLCLNTI